MHLHIGDRSLDELRCEEGYRGWLALQRLIPQIKDIKRYLLFKYVESVESVDSQNSKSPSKLLVIQSVPKQQGFLVKWPCKGSSNKS